MKQYHLMYTNIEKEAVLAVRTAVKSGLFKKDKLLEERKKILWNLHNDLCVVYKIEVINIEYIDGFWGIGQYDRNNNKIILNKISLVTYLHEFCHYMRIIKKEKNTEEIARGWSISLFYLATPKLCKVAIEKGLIIHQKSMNPQEDVPITDVQVVDATEEENKNRNSIPIIGGGEFLTKEEFKEVMKKLKEHDTQLNNMEEDSNVQH